ncbi:MAG: ABC transporter permease, partial [Proteobacteria bacterium]
DMTRAFRINLTALAMLALVIGLFLVFNSVGFQVVRRRPLFGLFRALGVTANGVLGYLAAEAAVVASIGVASGLLLGVALSRVLYAMVTGTIDALYFDLAQGVVTLDPLTLAKSAGLGAAATLLAAGVPALEARRTPPRGLLLRSSQESPRARFRGWAIFSALAVVASLAIVWVTSQSLVAAFIALFLLIIGAAGLAPIVVAGLSRLCEAPASRLGLPVAAMAVRNVRAHLSRTGVAAVALSVAVAATLGVGLMIDSFRTSVENWLKNYLRADIYISMPQNDAPAFASGFVDALRRIDGVEGVSLGRRMTIEDPVHGPVEMFLLDTTRDGFAGFQIKSGGGNDLWRRFTEGGEVLVSEPFARRFLLAPGDAIELLTDRGPREFTVAAVYYDYSTDRGVVTLSPETFARAFEPRGYRAASLYVADGSGVAAHVLAEFERTLNADGVLYARSNRELREASLAIFDRTFEVTGILRVLAIVVAITGIVSALMALQLERAREYAMLRAIGLTRAQLGRQVFGETGLTGLAAGLLAVPIGLALSVLLIRVINVRSFGWSMQTVVDPWLIAQAIALAVAAALAAGVYPAMRFRAFDVAQGLRND